MTDAYTGYYHPSSMLGRLNTAIDYKHELDDETDNRRKRSLWSNIGGMALGVLPNLLFPGLGILASAGLAGLGTFVGRKAGGELSGVNLKDNIGKFNIRKDEQANKLSNERDITSSLQAGLTAGMFKYLKDADWIGKSNQFRFNPFHLNDAPKTFKGLENLKTFNTPKNVYGLEQDIKIPKLNLSIPLYRGVGKSNQFRFNPFHLNDAIVDKAGTMGGTGVIGGAGHIGGASVSPKDSFVFNKGYGLDKNLAIPNLKLSLNAGFQKKVPAILDYFKDYSSDTSHINTDLFNTYDYGGF